MLCMTLLKAIKNGDLKKAKTYLDKKTCVSEKVVKKAIESGYPRMVKYMCSKINYIFHNFHSYFMVACRVGNIKIIKCLIGTKYINLQNYEYIDLACFYNNFKVVKQLIECGTNVKLFTCLESLEIMRSTLRSSNIEIIKYLVEKGIKITELIIDAACVNSENFNILRYLINTLNSENENVIERNKFMFLQTASYNNNYDVVNYLIANETNVKTNENYVIRNLSVNLHYASEKVLSIAIRTINNVICSGGDFNVAYNKEIIIKKLREKKYYKALNCALESNYSSEYYDVKNWLYKRFASTLARTNKFMDVLLILKN